MLDGIVTFIKFLIKAIIYEPSINSFKIKFPLLQQKRFSRLFLTNKKWT